MSMEVSVTSKPIREPWTRAVSLDKPEVARTLTPVMVEGEPRWKQWLAACDNGKTTEDREVELLLALMAASSFPDHVSGPGLSFPDRREPDIHSGRQEHLHPSPPLEQQPVGTEGEQVIERPGVVVAAVGRLHRVHDHLPQQAWAGKRQRLTCPAFRRWRRQNELVSYEMILPMTRQRRR